ncbi:MAG: hypothetical protein JNM72_20370 [Deltaproteobacteria bacterium]|nr:hypothetical protein [Deltaproteobacteria bacterium]
MTGTRDLRSLRALLPLLVLALGVGCKKEVANEESSETEPTVDWTVGGDDGSDGSDGSDGGEDTAGDAASAEAEPVELEAPADQGATLIVVGAR